MTKPASQCQVGGDHYKKLAIQPGEFCEKNGITGMAVDAIGYICREHVLEGGDGNRGGAQDLKKAIHCLNLRLQWKYGEAYESESTPTEVTSDREAEARYNPVDSALVKRATTTPIPRTVTSDPLAETGEYQLSGNSGQLPKPINGVKWEPDAATEEYNKAWS